MLKLGASLGPSRSTVMYKMGNGSKVTAGQWWDRAWNVAAGVLGSLPRVFSFTKGRVVSKLESHSGTFKGWLTCQAGGGTEGMGVIPGTGLTRCLLGGQASLG